MGIKTALKDITSSYAKDYKDICERSREERIKSLEPGATLPKTGVLYGEDARQSFKVKADTHRAKANELINTELAKLNESMTAAPTTEAVNTLQLLKMRSNVTAADINNLMGRYGDNTQVYDTLLDIAAQHGIREYAYTRNPIRERAEKLNDLKSSINNNLRLERAERGYATDGFISFLNAAIDDALPGEE